MRRGFGRILGCGILAVIALFLLIQLVPYGRNHNDPPVAREPNWDSPQTRALAQRACFDCHSNQTVWLWYSNIAPFSWLVQHDVDEGRRTLNFSEWQGLDGEQLDRVSRVIERGSMPPIQYTVIHPGAILNNSEKQELIQGLTKTAQR